MCSPDVIASVRRQLRANPGLVNRRRLLAGGATAIAGGAIAPMAAAAQGATPVASPVPVGGSIAWTSVASLSHVTSPATPVWPGTPTQFVSEPYVTYDTDGYFANILTLSEHTGTHMDAPAHFFEGAATADQVNPGQLVAPLAMIDVSAQVASDEDYGLTVDDILGWEAEHGALPAGAFVAMYSGWGDRIDDTEAFLNADADGVMHFPGFSPDAATFLVEERSIVGIGSDTMSQDPGNSTDFGTHVAILGSGRYGIEAVANLETVPASGATVVLGAANHAGGSGGPTRVLALY